MPNQVTLTFAGDADKLSKEAKRAEKAVLGVGDAATESSQDMEKNAKSSGDMTDRMSKLGNIVDGASTAVGDAAGAFSALADVQDMGRQSAQKMERALNDVAQAQEDYNQAVRDGKQATIDADQAQVDQQQALLDQATAQDALTAAIREFGAGSDEAKQAQIDLAQAGVDVRQADEDHEQALRDSSQAAIDAKGAQLDLNDAQSEANPGPLRAVADVMDAFGPLLQGIIGIMALVTAGQWAWNSALFASPITWILVGVGALIAVIVLIATKTNWFAEAWNASWGWITRAAGNAWNWIKQIPGWIASTFGTVSNAISAPFKAAFNGIAWLWNNTVGRLDWTVPGWVPGIGGYHVGVPHLPTFHTGGVVEGTPGEEVVALLQAGERVIPASRAGTGDGVQVTFAGNTSDALASVIQKLIRTGDIQLARS